MNGKFFSTISKTQAEFQQNQATFSNNETSFLN